MQVFYTRRFHILVRMFRVYYGSRFEMYIFPICFFIWYIVLPFIKPCGLNIFLKRYINYLGKFGLAAISYSQANVYIFFILI